MHAEKEHSMKHRWPLVTLGVVALAAGGAPFAWGADQTVYVPAPPSEAHAVALELKDLLTIGETAATSGPKDGTAEATALGIGGNPLVAGETGGSQSGDGTNDGALIQLEKGPLQEGGTDVEVTPYDVGVNGKKSDSRAAAARAGVATLLRADVLQSESHTTYSDGKSSGNAASDGVHLCVIGDCKAGSGLEVVVLHSESGTEANGHSYVLRLNDTPILTDEQLGNANDVCGLTLGKPADPGLFAQVLCAGAVGGQGANGTTTENAASSVANVTALGETAAGNLFDTKVAGGTAPPAILAPAPAPAVALPEVVQGAVAEAAQASAALPAASGALAFTGSFAFRGLLFGLGLLLLGAVARMGRRVGGLAGSRA
jgi:hypothetical protein